MKDMQLDAAEIIERHVAFLRSMRLGSALLWFCMFCIIIVWDEFGKAPEPTPGR